MPSPNPAPESSILCEVEKILKGIIQEEIKTEK